MVELENLNPSQVRLDGHGPQSSIPVNTDDMTVPFETPLFKGRFLMRVKGLTSGVPDQGHGAQAYFRGKKRLVQCAVQVRRLCCRRLLLATSPIITNILL